MFEYRCKVLNVVDGDTLDVNIDLGFDVWIKQRVRLMGLNTPEIHSANAGERTRAQAAKQFVLDTLAARTPASGILPIKTYKDDKYGRILADVVLPLIPAVSASPVKPIKKTLASSEQVQMFAKEAIPETTLNAQLLLAGHALPYNGVGAKPI